MRGICGLFFMLSFLVGASAQALPPDAPVVVRASGDARHDEPVIQVNPELKSIEIFPDRWLSDPKWLEKAERVANDWAQVQPESSGEGQVISEGSHSEYESRLVLQIIRFVRGIS